MIGGGIAGLSGVLFGIWGFRQPEMFSLPGGQVIIWVIVGGIAR